MNSLSGKTALVTGASRGIGRATALALAKDGAQVPIHYSRPKKEADAVIAEIRRTGGRADKVNADLALKDGPASAGRTGSRSGRSAPGHSRRKRGSVTFGAHFTRLR